MSESKVRDILTRECYVTGKIPLKYTVFSENKDGKRVQVRRINHTANVPKIIDRKTWDVAQRIKEAHLSYRHRKKFKFLFRGKIRCAACDTPLHYLNAEGKYSYYAHRCVGKKQITLPSKLVDEAVWKALVSKLQDKVELKRTIEALKERHPEKDIASLKDQREAVEAQIKALQRDIQKLSDRILAAEDLPVIEVYEKKISKISKRITALENSIDRLEDQIEELESMKENIKDANGLVREIQKRIGNLEDLTFEQKRSIVDRIYPPGSIEFFPKWYLESDERERDPRAMLYLEVWQKRLESSRIDIGRGILFCFGIIDEDFWEARKGRDGSGSNGKTGGKGFWVNKRKEVIPES